MENYENKFIDSNPDIKKIVDQFSEYLHEDNPELTLSEIENRVSLDAALLWKEAVWQNQGYILTKKDPKTEEQTQTKVEAVLGDRPLYWARNCMQVFLKRHPLFKKDINIEKYLVKKGTNLERIIQIFEEKSRNYTGINFTEAPAGAKKVLITGFNPFQLNPDKNFVMSMGIDSTNTFNPSGIISLYLNNNQKLIEQNIYIQTCVFPVRYGDFDNECVEKVIKKYINKVDTIITTSLNGGNNWFDIEENAIEYRGGFHDNMCIGGQDYLKFNFNTSRFIPNTSNKHNKTTLPQSKIFGSLNTTIAINDLIIKFDTSMQSSLTDGSGGNYLSNEIMFRTTSIRDNPAYSNNSSKPIGHFHLANLNTITRIDEIINVTQEIIKKIIN